MEQENWINEILESTRGLTSALPDAKLYSKIQYSIESQKKVAPQWVWLAAASIILLVTLNIHFVLSKSSKKEEASELIASSLTKSNQLY